ncbi:hypothetical protein [Coleofasciculus sp. FACHB-1120]|uniref:hypothetical protein n=1 Tax=Coleofasciculus sp. FACHB-1120 TaxID=2692783 RepID=UPI001683414C|nr:hypothetical protein [Coleofasciculus sp. FACHB-1120]MBD2744712.1 hypothetical protein [Coleofasciculus sp. FACHB-1120]
MSNISISDLKPAGYELFADSESYLEDIHDDALANNISGGSTPFCVASVIAWTINQSIVISVVVYTTTKD